MKLSIFSMAWLSGFSKLWLYLATVYSLSACFGGSGGASAPVLNMPDIPDSPIASLVLDDDYVAFLIGSQPIGTDPSLASSRQFSQFLYQLDADNNITPVVMLDQQGNEVDLIGNLSFTDVENIIPLDVMIMSPEYIMLTIFHRNFDTDPDNDYFNLLVHLRTGNVVEAPVGLNKQGNSGRSTLTTLGRDYFPPDTRWNDTQDLYVVGLDFDALELMISGDFVEDPDHQEPVDHHSGVPCPPLIEEAEEAAGDDTDTPATDDTTTDDITSDTTDTSTSEDTTDTSDTETTEPTTANETGSNCVEPSDTQSTEQTETVDETENADSNQATANSAAPQAPFTPSARTNDAASQALFNPGARATADDEPPLPTAIYRMHLGASSSYSLEKISAADDRPGLGQFIVSRSGIIIYRNLDGGDNSYRVLLDNCEDITGRLSTVLIAKHTSLIVADDDAGNSSIFEVTERGMNKLIFSCNGNVTRQAFSGYSTGINSLHLPYNSPSIASYDFQYPYFINDSCQGGRLFPQQIPVTQILNPMPFIPGLPGVDVRGLRKSQLFNGRLYCIGYDTALQLAVAELNPDDANPQYRFLNFDFNFWIPDFDTVHVLGNGQVIFTGSTATSSSINTVILDQDGTSINLNDTLGGFKAAQQINITPPTGAAP